MFRRYRELLFSPELRRLVRELGGHRRVVASAIVCGVLAALLDVAWKLGLMPVLRDIFSTEHGKAAFAQISLALGAVIGLYLLRGLAAYGQSYLTNVAAQRLVRDLRQKLYSHIQRLPIGYFDTERTGHLMSRIVVDTSLVQNVLAGELINIVTAPVRVIGGIGAMLWCSWRLTAASVLVFPAVALLIYAAGRRMRRHTGEVQSRMADLSAMLQETLSAIRLVRAYNTQEYEERRFGERNLETVRASLRAARISAALQPLVELVAMIAIASAMLVGGWEIVQTRLDGPRLLLFVIFAQQVGTSLNSLARMNLSLQQLAAAAARIFDILALQPEVIERPNARPLAKVHGAIALENVSFAYDGKEQVLRDVSFRLAPGEKVALVGVSGAGKSTIANLVLRLYEPNSGRVTVDDQDVRDVTVSSLRQAIALVPQETTLFSGTVAENIAYGRQDLPRESIQAAAVAAGADDFIRALPQGYDTLVGERGVTLSGGQRQRVAIARALVRDPKVLILDEATSSLDAGTEAAVQEALQAATRGRTTLIIAHRLSSLRKVDRIILLQNGAVAEAGSHAELVRKRGAYYSLYRLQQVDQQESGAEEA
jgi:subfamily B ATP-binding cassette protein MsbA